jgi:hypothetical protein
MTTIANILELATEPPWNLVQFLPSRNYKINNFQHNRAEISASIFEEFVVVCRWPLGRHMPVNVILSISVITSHINNCNKW